MTTTRIYLIGLMGAGKSTVGHILASKLDWTFQDLDHEVEKICGKTIPKIFKDEGEDSFRDHESKALLNTLEKERIIIACGGGVVTRKENVHLLKNEQTVWLELSIAQAAMRLEYADDRPLLSECEDTIKELEQILESRREGYTEASSLRVNSGDSSAEMVAEKILERIENIHV